MKTEALTTEQPKASHTPGRFRVETEYPYCGNIPRDFIAIVDEAGDELARINPNTPRSIALGNAHLMAAAPAMLEMLVDCLDTFEGEVKYLNGCSTRDMTDKLRAAIVKAKGGAK